MHDDAGVKEVFRGDLSAVEMAAGILEERGIECQRQWEQAGGTAFTIGDTALVPGRVAVLLVPSIAVDEAKEALVSFSEPEPDYLTEISGEVAANRDRRRTFARVVAVVMLAPLAIWAVVIIVGLVMALFRMI